MAIRETLFALYICRKFIELTNYKVVLIYYNISSNEIWFGSTLEVYPVTPPHPYDFLQVSCLGVGCKSKVYLLHFSQEILHLFSWRKDHVTQVPHMQQRLLHQVLNVENLHNSRFHSICNPPLFLIRDASNLIFTDLIAKSPRLYLLTTRTKGG